VELKEDGDIMIDKISTLSEIPLRRDEKNPVFTRITYTREQIYDSYKLFLFGIFKPIKPPKNAFNFEISEPMPHWKYVYKRDVNELYNEINWELSPDLKIAKFHRSEMFSAISLGCCLLLSLRFVFCFIF